MLLINFDDACGDASYRGKPLADGQKRIVKVRRKPLSPRLDLARISPGGLNWGYGGDGPGQLALAILAHAAGEKTALREWDRFREEVISQLDFRQGFF